MPCELEGCVYVIHRDGGMPLWFAVERLRQHQLNHVPHVRQPVQQEKVDTKQVDTAQPIQKEVVTEQVDTTQPIHQERQVLLSMGGGHSDDQLPLPTTQPDVCGGGRCTTSPWVGYDRNRIFRPDTGK